MKGEVIGSIEPWDDDNAQIPAHLFQKRVKTLNSDTSKNKFLGLSRTEETVIRKLKTDENGIYFRKTGQKIFTVDFHRCRDSNSNLKKALCAARREEIVLVGRKKSIKGMEINSIKKKIMDFDIYQSNPLHSLLHSKKNIQKKHISQSQIEDVRKKRQEAQRDRNHVLRVKRVNLLKKPEVESGLFFSMIANISKEKNKLVESQIGRLSAQIKVERGLFMKKNNKFRSWHNLSKLGVSVSGYATSKCFI